MLKKSPLLAALAMVLMLSGCFEDEKKTEAPAPAAAEIVQTSEGEVSNAVIMDGDEQLSVGITEEAAPAIDISALTSGEWLLEQIRGVAVIADSNPSMSVDAEGKVSGDGSCNRFFAESRPAPDNQISFLGIGSTKRACADMARNDQEMKFLNGFHAVAAWHVDEDTGTLHLTDANGGDVLVFSKAPLVEDAQETEETPAAE